MPAPAISVLVPVFNAGPFLSECLESIRAQDFEDYELLLSDDASSDDSVEVIEQYARRDSRIRWWRNPENLGIGRNWNVCLRAARGRFIKFVLQDDKLLNASALRRLMALLEANPSVSLAASASEIIDTDSRPTRTRDWLQKTDVRDGKQIIVRCFNEETNLIGEPSVVMFRREQAARGFDEHLQQLVDLEMWFHLLEQGMFAYVPEPLCAFRVHADQQTQRNRRAGVAHYEMIDLLRSCCERRWMREAAATDYRVQQMLSSQRYYLRKRHGARAATVVDEIYRMLGARRYGQWWVMHKITQPFCNLGAWMKKRLPRSSRAPRRPHADVQPFRKS